MDKKTNEKLNKKNKKNVAVIFGGASSEYGVSLESVSAVIRNLDRDKYNPVIVGISRQGEWFYYTGDISKIQNDTWCNKADCVPAVLSPNRTEHKLILLKEEGTESILVDVAFPVMHGRNGEDGTVQGLVELAGIPLAGCGTLASALCMDKDRAHRLAGLSGVRVPEALVLMDSAKGNVKHEGEDLENMIMERAEKFARSAGYPIFVKPLKAGSSYGVTKVESKDELASAVRLAFQYDDQVILEENIEGFEVGCAVLGKDRLIIGEVDEIELSNGFFDFTEKYTLKTSKIHVPARISAEKAEEIKEAAGKIYHALGCCGFARVDMFLTPEGGIVFNEVNTIPGFTEHSRYPGMMRAAGYTFAEIIDLIIGQALEN